MPAFLLRTAWFWLLLVGLLPGPARAQERELAALLKRENVAGMQLVYSKKGVIKSYSLGLRNAKTAQAMQATSILQAASLGKVVEAYVALRLHDRGLLDLDKPLLAYVAYPRLQGQPAAGRITARLVLSHASGLPNWAENPLKPTWPASPLALRYPPDSCWNYSGEGFVLLQKALEALTHKSFETLAREEVFGPLGMPHGSFTWQPRFAASACPGHDAAGRPTTVQRFAAPYAAFSLLTTASDYHRFLQALLAGRGLKPATVRLLGTPLSAANRCGVPSGPQDPFIAWGAGVGLAATSHGPALWHWGDNGDFKGFFMVFPARQEALVLLTNSANGQKITEEVLRLFFGPGQYRALAWLAAE